MAKNAKNNTERVNLEDYPMDEEAYAFFTQKGTGEDGTDRHSFADGSVLHFWTRVAYRLGRQITVTDIEEEELFGFDETVEQGFGLVDDENGYATCPICLETCDNKIEAKFRPRFWLFIGPDGKPQLDRFGDEDELRRSGSFVIITDPKTHESKIHGFCPEHAYWICRHGYDENGDEFERKRPLKALTYKSAMTMISALREKQAEYAREHRTRSRAARKLFGFRD